jgi:hypothetical protein
LHTRSRIVLRGFTVDDASLAAQPRVVRSPQRMTVPTNKKTDSASRTVHDARVPGMKIAEGRAEEGCCGVSMDDFDRLDIIGMGDARRMS